MAEAAFEYVCTVVCNYTAVYFHRPKELVLTDPVIRAWAAAADDPSVKAVVCPPEHLIQSVDAAERDHLMSRAFASWVTDNPIRRVEALDQRRTAG